MTAKMIGAPAQGLDVTAAIDLPAAIILLAALSVGATACTGYRLRSIRLTGNE